MLTISAAIGQLIVNYHQGATSSGMDSRLVIPGLTMKIAMEIHDYLREKDIKAYLVISDDLSPDEEKSWISPIGLTSKRIGSFVAVTCPGQLAQIQDSIRGSGGAIRSVAFSEEWPWIDNGSEYFRFRGPVLEELIKSWTGNKEHQKWMSEFILKYLITSTRSHSQRATLLLEKLLGNFGPALYPDLIDIRLKLLFHMGIPRPDGELPAVDVFHRKTSKLCEQIVEKCRKEDGARQQAIDMIPEVVGGESENITRESIVCLLDGIGRSKTLDLGILAFFSCWDDNVPFWLTLDTTNLARIFQVRAPEAATITCSLLCDRGYISTDGDCLATFLGEEIRFKIQYSLPINEPDNHAWILRLSYRRGTVQEKPVESSEGSTCFNVDTARFARHKSVLSLKIALLADDTVRAETRVKLHLCGPQRPSFVIVEPGFEAIDTNIGNVDDIADKKIETNEPSHIYMFSHDGQEPVLTDSNQNELAIIEKFPKSIWRSGQIIDPTEDASGQVTRICRFGSVMSVICFEATDIERGEFTLEDELRVQIAGGREGNIKELIAIFSGKSKEPYSRLGQINESSRRRTRLADDVTEEQGWRPLIVNLLKCDLDEAGLLGDYVSYRGQVLAPGFNGLSLPEQARNLLTEYLSARSSLRKTVLASIENSGSALEHPAYASHPIYVDASAKELTDLMIGYLHTYKRILDYVVQARTTLAWSQLFVMIYLDCVIHWDETALRNSFFLIGPWHPLVIAKRYMIQSSLFKRARGLEEEGGKLFRQLTVLLREVVGFRWIPGLHRNDRVIEQLYVTPTSDPGWHLAIKQDISSAAMQSREVSLANILSHLVEHLGLHTPILQESTEGIAVSGLANFMRAFPSRRTLGVRARKGYSLSEIINSMDHFLHVKKEPTEYGLQLPGGIHLFTEDTIEELDEVNWSKPPILVYQCASDRECLDIMSPDVYLLAPTQDISFGSTEVRYGMPRGLGMQSIFCEPLCWLTEGQAQLPISMKFELDAPPKKTEDLGDEFVEATAKVCQIWQNQVVTLRAVDLPQRLDCPWAIIPGSGLDPAIFVKYVNDGSSRSLQERALWDYRLDVTGSKNTYYILSTIPKGFGAAVNGFFSRNDVAPKFIEDLGALGIAVGGEALKSGRHALGVIGLVGTIRLIQGIGGSGKGVFRETEDCVGFLIPIDSFISFFDGKNVIKNEIQESHKRSDLLAIQLVLPKNPNSKLEIYACSIESKFVSKTFSHDRAIEALEQAHVSLKQFKTLVETGGKLWAIPERLGLLAIVKFGLRITSSRMVDRNNRWTEIERRVFQYVLRGEYEFKKAKHEAIVVSTEGQLPGIPETRPMSEGLWVRINREHWPGITDTPQLDQIRDELAHLFGLDIGEGPNDTSSYEERATSEMTRPIESFPPSQEPTQTAEITSIIREDADTTILLPAGTNRIATTIGHGSEMNDVHVQEPAPLRRILIGVNDARRPVYFDPQSPVDPLDNLNLMVTGSSGTGKTQFLKYLMCKLREQGKNILVLDFKNDFATDQIFINRASLDFIHVNFDGLPFNPLIPYPIRHPNTGQLVVQIGQHISGLASVLKRTYGLGAQQQIDVKNAISQSFDDRGIPTSGTTPFNSTTEFPDFNSVGLILQEANQLAYNRLDPLFTLDLFRTERRRDSFESLVNHSMGLNLSQIPSNEIKNTLAELVVLSAHAYYNAQVHSGTIRQILVFDEAHRVLNSDFMKNLVRECRAYGVGTVLSSQYPTDYPADISSSMATKVLHGNGTEIDRVRGIVQTIGCTGREAEVSSLERFQAFIDNRHYPQTIVRTMNYPLYLLWTFLLNQDVTTRDMLVDLEGIDTNKLPIGYLLNQLAHLGIIDERDGIVRLLTRHD